MARKGGSVTTPPDASRKTAAGIGRSQRSIWRWGFTPCPERLSIVRDWPGFGVWGNAPASNQGSRPAVGRRKASGAALVKPLFKPSEFHQHSSVAWAVLE